MTKETYSIPWRQFARRWQKYYRPPGRPSKEAIKYYKKYLGKVKASLKRKARVLIYGSTPELRDLCFQEKCDVTFVDINIEMIFAMSQLVKYPNDQEIIVRADWRYLPLRDGYYDAVLGDIVISNIPYQDQRLFIEGLCRILKPNGYFITKMSLIPDNWKFTSFDDILQKYTKASYSKSSSMELLCHLYTQTFDQKYHTVDLKLLRAGLSKYWHHGKYHYPNAQVEHMLNDMWAMWKPLNKVWSFSYARSDEIFLSKFFNIKEKIILKDCTYREVDKTFPIWFMQAKK